MIKCVLYFISVFVCVQSCYWNDECPYPFYGTKTPYDTVRGDIRDIAVPQNCTAVSLWALFRHGNRNPEDRETKKYKDVVSLRDEILESYASGRSQMCAQDIENLKNWTWNIAQDDLLLTLTNIGFEEVHGIGKRIREKYPYLLHGADEDYYFRPVNEERTVTSAVAFIDGLTESTNLTLTPAPGRPTDNVIKSYENCERYQDIKSTQLKVQLDAYFNSSEFKGVMEAMQRRLGISTQLNKAHIWGLYELCRLDRSWSTVYKSPWCAVFSNQDLVVLDYRDDVRHYYRNGPLSSVNVKLGASPLKDLIETLEDSVNGGSKKIISYFTHSTMVKLVFCALGLFSDAKPIQGSHRDPNRLYRTSILGASASNIITVLNRCEESGNQSYRVQLFVNEKESEVCPLGGCSWEQFQQKFEKFKSFKLDFCGKDI